MPKPDLRQLQENIKILSGAHLKTDNKIIDAIVVSVNEDEGTCVVDYLDSSVEGMTIMINPTISDGENDIPEIGSNIKVSTGLDVIPHIVNSTDLSKKTIVIGDTYLHLEDGIVEIEQGSLTIVLSNGKITLNDGSFGGLIKIMNLIARLNSVESALSDLIIKYNAHVHSGSGVVTTNISTKVVTNTQKSDIENTKIIHGQ